MWTACRGRMPAAGRGPGLLHSIGSQQHRRHAAVDRRLAHTSRRCRHPLAGFVHIQFDAGHALAPALSAGRVACPLQDAKSEAPCRLLEVPADKMASPSTRDNSARTRDRIVVLVLVRYDRSGARKPFCRAGRPTERDPREADEPSRSFVMAGGDMGGDTLFPPSYPPVGFRR